MTDGALPGYELRECRPEDEGEVLELLRLALGGGPGGRRTEAFFRWKHHENPFGRSLAYVAVAPDGTIAGFRTFMRWRWRTADRTWAAVRAVDTATHPDHRGVGIFRTLTLHAVEAMRRDDVDLVFNTPNQQSRPGYLKMGWSAVGTVPVAIRPVRWVRFGRAALDRRDRRAPGPIDCPLPPAATAFAHPDGVASLLRASHPFDDRLATDRTLEYLRWRYADAPGLDYRVVVLGRPESPDGLAFARPRARGGLRELTLAEIVVADADGDGRAVRALGRAAARGSGCDHVATLAGPDPGARASLLAAGYLSWPGRGIGLTANVLGTVDPDPMVLSSWRLGLGDLEVF